MKKFKLYIIIFLSGILFIMSCNLNIKENELKKESIPIQDISMWKNYFYESGMKYVLLRDKFSHEIIILNITKDSLACEFYKDKK